MNSTTEKTVPVFVYGTLKQGFVNHGRFLQDLSKVKDAIILGRMYDVMRKFPAVTESVDTDFQVHGEIFEVPESRMSSLDWLEGHPNLYLRKTIKTTDGDEVQAYLYQLSVKDFNYIKSGVWE